MNALVNRTDIARVVGTTRETVERLVKNGVLPKPIEKTAPPLWPWPAVEAALQNAGIPLAGLNGPAVRETK